MRSLRVAPRHLPVHVDESRLHGAVNRNWPSEGVRTAVSALVTSAAFQRHSGPHLRSLHMHGSGRGGCGFDFSPSPGSFRGLQHLAGAGGALPDGLSEDWRPWSGLRCHT